MGFIQVETCSNVIPLDKNGRKYGGYSQDTNKKVNQ